MVVERDGSKSLELTTAADLSGSPAPEHAYLATADFNDFQSSVDPLGVATVRLYTIRDRVRKLLSTSGFLLLLPSLAAVLAASTTLLSVVMPAPADSTADRAHAVLLWAGQPLTNLNSTIQPTVIAQAHAGLDNRALRTEWCLQSIQGHQAPAAGVPSISCAPTATSWWRKNWTAVCGGGLSLLTALTVVWAAARRSRFQQSP